MLSDLMANQANQGSGRPVDTQYADAMKTMTTFNGKNWIAWWTEYVRFEPVIPNISVEDRFRQLCKSIGASWIPVAQQSSTRAYNEAPEGRIAFWTGFNRNMIKMLGHSTKDPMALLRDIVERRSSDPPGEYWARFLLAYQTYASMCDMEKIATLSQDDPEVVRHFI